MLCRKDTMEYWKAVINVEKKILKVKTHHDREGEQTKLKMLQTCGGHFALNVSIHEEMNTE